MYFEGPEKKVELGVRPGTSLRALGEDWWAQVVDRAGLAGVGGKYIQCRYRDGQQQAEKTDRYHQLNERKSALFSHYIIPS